MYTYLPAPNLINNLIKSFFVFTLTPLLLLLLRSLNRLKIGVSPIHDEKDDEEEKDDEDDEEEKDDEDDEEEKDDEDDEVDVKNNYINKNVAQTIK